MNKIIKISVGFLLLTLMAFVTVPKIDNDCEILHEGTFTYGNSENLVKVIIKGKKHIEYHNNEKYYIKSKLDWVNECEYNMTITKVTLPNFPYKKGDIMNVKIDKVEGDKIYFTSVVKQQSWSGVFTKIE